MGLKRLNKHYGLTGIKNIILGSQILPSCKLFPVEWGRKVYIKIHPKSATQHFEVIGSNCLAAKGQNK